MIHHLLRSALTRNTQAFSSIKHVGGGSRNLVDNKIVPPPLLARWNCTVTEFTDNNQLRQFTLNKAKSAGRNSSGRVTSFHRGGGAKRLRRRIDLKRSTSALGVIERIEYDPNRSSRIALVRWQKGVHLNRQRTCKSIDEFLPPCKILEPTETTIGGSFSYSSLHGMADQRKVVRFPPTRLVGKVVGLPNRMPPWSKSPFTSKGVGDRTRTAKDVFFSTLSSAKARKSDVSLSIDSPFGFPRIVVAGAKPAFFALRKKGEVTEEKGLSRTMIQKWGSDSIFNAHRIKRKAALSWQAFGRQESLGLVGTAEHYTLNPKTDQDNTLKSKTEFHKFDRVPVSYIIASHQLEAGKMVMNCDWSNPIHN